jgi:hypothetical protein
MRGRALVEGFHLFRVGQERSGDGDGARGLVPAQIDNVKLPLEFRRRQAADLTGWKGDPSDDAFQALCDGIAATAGTTPAPRPGDSQTRSKANFRWNQSWVITSGVAIAAISAGAVYLVGLYLPQQPERSQASSEPAPIKPSGEKEEPKTLSSSREDRTFSPAKRASPASQPEPQTTSEVRLEAGVLEFKWPGSDCWKIYRGEEQVKSDCGSGKHALQAGTYIVKPSHSAAFAPFKIEVEKGRTVTVP